MVPFALFDTIIGLHDTRTHALLAVFNRLPMCQLSQYDRVQKTRKNQSRYKQRFRTRLSSQLRPSRFATTATNVHLNRRYFVNAANYCN